MKVEKILVLLGRKELIEGKERTIIKETKYYIKDLNKDYSTKYGTIKKEELKS